MTSVALGRFACPSCFSPLKAEGTGGIGCAGPGHHEWPVVNGAPNFLGAVQNAGAVAGVARDYTRWHALAGARWEKHRVRVWNVMIRKAVWAAPPPGALLDIGAGWGGLAAAAEKKGFESYAADAAAPPAGPYFRAAASMETLPFGDASVRVVWMCGSLHYAADLSAPLPETRRVLQPSGILVMGLTPVHTDRRPADGAAEKTRREMPDAGATGRRSTTYPHLVESGVQAALESSSFESGRLASGLGPLLAILRMAKSVPTGNELARFQIYACRPRPLEGRGR